MINNYISGKYPLLKLWKCSFDWLQLADTGGAACFLVISWLGRYGLCSHVPQPFASCNFSALNSERALWLCGTRSQDAHYKIILARVLAFSSRQITWIIVIWHDFILYHPTFFPRSFSHAFFPFLELLFSDSSVRMEPRNVTFGLNDSIET